MKNNAGDFEKEIRKQIFQYDVFIFDFVLRNLNRRDESLSKVRNAQSTWAEELNEQFGEILPEYLDALRNEENISLLEKLNKYRITYERIEKLKKVG